MKGFKKQHNLTWFKAYILIIALVCAFFLGVKVFVQAQSAPVAPNFCSKTDTVNITTSQVINCGTGYHIEGNTCAANSYGDKTWFGNIFNGLMFQICGNGAVEAGEECDDANTNNTDACNNTCKWTVRTEPVVVQSPIKINSSADGVIFGDGDTNDSDPISGGTFLKLTKAMFTPYLYVALYNSDQVAKIRTFSNCVGTACYKRTSSGWSTTPTEWPGEIVATFTVGDNPSRTAVNVETGDVWIGNRGVQASGEGTSLMRFSIDGTLTKTCYETDMGGSPCKGIRGVVIAENGDVWIGCYMSGVVYQISGTGSSCIPIKTVNVGGAPTGPYGLAIDSNGNVWVSNRGTVSVQKINSAGTIVGSWPVLAGSPYGITIDLNDNAWLGGWSQHGVYKVKKDQTTGTAARFIDLSAYDADTTGIATALDGSIWASGFWGNDIIKIIPDATNPDLETLTPKYDPGYFYYPRGMSGDSEGYMWVVNDNVSVNVTSVVAYDMTMTRVLAIAVGDATTGRYSYSDMTGLNRAMVLRSGFYQEILDSGISNMHWGNIAWDQKIDEPVAKQDIAVYVRVSNTNNSTTNDMGGATWRTVTDWNGAALSTKAGRYLQIKVVLGSTQKGITPVVSNLRIIAP